MVEGDSEVFEGVCVEDIDLTLWGCSTSRLSVYVPGVGMECLPSFRSRFVEVDYFSFICVNFDSSFFAPTLACVDALTNAACGTSAATCLPLTLSVTSTRKASRHTDRALAPHQCRCLWHASSCMVQFLTTLRWRVLMIK